MRLRSPVRFLLSAAIVLIIPCSEVSADDARQRAERLLGLDFAEILNIEVNISSKRDERLLDSPGIVSIISSQEIARYGAKDLGDLLLRLPGVFPFGSAKFRDAVVSIRGQTSTHIDSHILILVNGRPTRESNGAGFNSAIYRGFPVAAIDRIEVIRGPGSVVYGTNAFSGVMNIITKDSSEEGSNEVSIGYGSHGTVLADAWLSRKWDDFSLSLSGKLLDSDGWKFRTIDQNGVDDSTDYSQQEYGFFGEVRYRKLTLTAFTVGHNDTILNLPPRWPETPQGGIVHRRHFVDLGYQHEISTHWRVDLNASYNGRDFIDDPNGRRLSAYDLLLEPALHGVLFDRVSVLLGGQYERLSGRSSDSGDYGVNRYRFYGQFDYSPWDFLKIVAGLQVNKSAGVDVNLSPRVGIIFKAKHSIGAKILYGEAFRSPSINEQTIDIPNLLGNPDLEPETIQTFSAQLNHSSSRHFVAVTYFWSEVERAIARIPGIGGQRTFANVSSVNYQGVELEAKAILSHGFSALGSFSFQENEDNTGTANVGLVANYMFKLGVAYDSDRGISLGLFNSHFSPAARLAGAAEVNPPADGFSWMTLQASVEARKLLKRPEMPNVKLTLLIDNLLDQDVYFPEFQSRRINTLPLRGGISAYGRIAILF